MNARARAVQHPSKQSRKEDRRKLGPLSQLVVQPRTRTRYRDSFNTFCKFHNLAEEFIVTDTLKVDNMAAECIEYMWEEGLPKSEASYLLAAIQFFRPQTKNHLVWSWKLVKTWNQVELASRATPLSPELVFSLAGQCFKWKQPRLGWLLILGFSGFLRTSELLNLKKKEVVGADKASCSEAVLLLENTKGTKRNFLPLDKVVLHEKVAIQAVKPLCKGLQPGDTLSQMSNHQFRSLFRSVLEALGLDNMGYMPYRLRRGGVTSAYLQGVPMDMLVTQGRWQHLPTARIYIDAGVQAMTQITLPTSAQTRCKAMRAFFISVSQEGTRGNKNLALT